MKVLANQYSYRTYDNQFLTTKTRMGILDFQKERKCHVYEARVVDAEKEELFELA